MRSHWIWFSLVPGISAGEKQALLRQFSDPEHIYEGNRAMYRRVEGLRLQTIEALLNKDLAPAQRIIKECAEKNIGIITFSDSAYPAKLRAIANPPLVLYCKGMLPDPEAYPMIGVVGTRSTSPYGENTARRIGAQIGICGGVVVTGGAMGIDTMAMLGTLVANSRCVVVLACGLDECYPKSNERLFQKILENGCMVSEYPPGTRTYKWSFLQRNRIISGMSQAVVVVEAPASSGALNTAQWANDQGRDVFVVPGNVDVASCAGSNGLLQEYATPVLSGWHVLHRYQALFPDTVRQAELTPEMEKALAQPAFSPVNTAVRPAMDNRKPDKKGIDKPDNTPYSVLDNQPAELSEEERQVMQYLTREPRPVDVVSEQVPLPAGRVLSILTQLCLRGVIRSHPGKQVSLK